MINLKNPENPAIKASHYLKTKKIDGFEVFCLEKKHLKVDARNGAVDSLEGATEVGLAVRVVNQKRLGFSYSTSLSDLAVKSCIENAISGSAVVDADEALSLPTYKKSTPLGWKDYDDDLLHIPVAKKIDTALALEASALNFDPKIKRVRRATYEETAVKKWLINSLDEELFHESTLLTCQVMAIAESNGFSHGAWDFSFSHTWDGLQVTEVGTRAAGDAIAMLGARAVSTIRTPVCLDPISSAQLIEIFCRGFYGDNVFKKKSPIADKLGSAQYSKKLTIVNDGLMKDGYESEPFDGEGTMCRPTLLVEGGVVKGWLVDSYWGKKMNRPSTGSSIRHAVTQLPSIGIHNVYLKTGSKTQEGLLREMGRGLFVNELAGLHTVNPVTGDFSLGVGGHWVEGGVRNYPVKGVVIAGNLHDIFKNITQVGNDLRFFGNIGSPTLLISEVQLSG